MVLPSAIPRDLRAHKSTGFPLSQKQISVLFFQRLFTLPQVTPLWECPYKVATFLILSPQTLCGGDSSPTSGGGRDSGLAHHQWITGHWPELFTQSQRGTMPHELGGRSAQSGWEPSCHHLELRMKQTWEGHGRDGKTPGVQWHMSHFSRWQLGFTAKWAPKFPFGLSLPESSLHSPATENLMDVHRFFFFFF